MATVDKRGQRETHQDTRKPPLVIDFDANPYDVDKLPKIDGVYKWVRVSMMGQADLKNVQKAKLEHWQPVLFDDLKVKADEQGLDVSYLLTTEFQHQQGVVGSHDMVLMMRPLEIDAAYKEHTRKLTRDQERAVDNQFDGAMPEGFMRMNDGKIPIIDD